MQHNPADSDAQKIIDLQTCRCTHLSKQPGAAFMQHNPERMPFLLQDAEGDRFFLSFGYPLAKPGKDFRGYFSPHNQEIFFLMLATGPGQPVAESAIVGEQQQSVGILVQTADREDAIRSEIEIQQCFRGAVYSQRAFHSPGFMKNQDLPSGRLFDRNPLPIHGNVFIPRDRISQHCRPAIHEDLSGTEELFPLTFRTEPDTR